MKQLTEIERFIRENIAHYKAWKCIDESFDHEIYEEMNPENCSYYLRFFDSIKAVKWNRYCLLN